MARLTTQTDVDTYNTAIIADGQTPMQVNDVIFFLSDKNAIGNIFSNVQYTGARLGATIWIEGGPESYNCIDINHPSLPVVPSDFDNPNHVHFFGGRGEVERGVDGFGGRDFQFINFDNIIIDFETNTYPGLRDGWGSGRTGTFGARVINNVYEQGAMSLRVDNGMGTMKRLEIRGCELSIGSFAKIRAILEENHLDKFIIERNLITRSGRGEGFYIGQTSTGASGQFGSLKNFRVRDNILCFTAAEALQLQQISDGTRIHNNVVFMAATDYRAAFQPAQDTGVQMVLAQGDVHFYNNLIIGFGTNGFHLFGTDLSGNGVPFGVAKPKIYNNAWAKGKAGIGWRVHNSFTMDAKILFRDNDIVNMADNYTDIGDIRNYYFEVDSPSNVGIEVIGGKIPDTTRPFLNPGKSNTGVKHFNVERAVQEEPQFIKTGFDHIDINEISRWSECYEQGVNTTDADTDVPANQIDPSTLVVGGTCTFTVTDSATSTTIAVGDYMRCKLRQDTTKKFYGRVQSYSGNTLVLDDLSNIEGSGVPPIQNIWDIDKIRTHLVGQFVFPAHEEEVLSMNLYRCIQQHDAVVGSPTLRRPETLAPYWELVQWDAAGRNMYDPLYDGTPVTADFMAVAGDFRLVKGTYHHLKGRGLSCNEQRDDQTMMGWQWKQTEFGTVRDIPGAYNSTLNISDYSYLKPTRYYRFWVDKRDSSGAFQGKIFSAWQQIP